MSCKTPGDPAIPITLTCKPGSTIFSNLGQTKVGDLLIATGDMTLDSDGNLPVIWLRSICKGYEDQYLNEAVVTGRLSGQLREAEKSDSSSIAVNRLDDAGKEATDWFRFRCFGANRERLVEAPKGALATVAGILDLRTSKDEKLFVEVKTRVLRLHARAGGHDAAAGKEATGYSNADFEGNDGPQMPHDWN